MTAADPSKPPSAAVDQRVYEPSMEEILASIRRIIADDQSLPNRAAVRDEELNLRAALDPVPPSEPAVPEPRPVPSPAAEKPAAWDMAPSRPARAQAPVPSMKEEPPVSKPGPAAPRVVVSSGSLGHIAAPQFAMPDSPVQRGSIQPKRGSEAEAALLRFTPPPPVAEARAPAPADPVGGGGVSEAKHSLVSSTTDQSVTAAFNALAASRLVENDDALKGLVREMIRPMLKGWLDDNLPNMVERLVRAEIERVGRGGR